MHAQTYIETNPFPTEGFDIPATESRAIYLIEVASYAPDPDEAIYTLAEDDLALEMSPAAASELLAAIPEPASTFDKIVHTAALIVLERHRISIRRKDSEIPL